MFRRLIFADSAAWFTLVAFITAASIYVAFGWRALRMKRPQRVRFSELPFSTPTPLSVRSCERERVGRVEEPLAHARGYAAERPSAS